MEILLKEPGQNHQAVRLLIRILKLISRKRGSPLYRKFCGIWEETIKWSRGVPFTCTMADAWFVDCVISNNEKHRPGRLQKGYKFIWKLIRRCMELYCSCKLFKTAEPIVSECEDDCAPRRAKIGPILCIQKSVFESPCFGCKFPSSQAFGNDRLNPTMDCRVHITDESTSDASEDHDAESDMDVANSQCDGTHYIYSLAQVPHDINDTCHMHSPSESSSCYIDCMSCHCYSSVQCRLPDVIVVETPATAHRNLTAKSANCKQRDAENHVENRVGTAMSEYRILLSLPGDSDSLENKIGKGERNFGSLPLDIQEHILKGLEYEQLFQVKVVSRVFRSVIESKTFRHSISKSSSLSLLYLYIKDGAFQWSGFDLVLKKWRPLPTLRRLPSPGQNLFKEYLVASAGGLMCANISKSLECERIVVCNPMTQSWRDLPPLNFPRNPVLLHMLVNPNANSYRIIAAGSSGMAEGHLSRKTEVFDSLTSQWEVTGDIPGFEFGLNEYQTGVYVDGILYCVAFLEDGSSKGLLGYDVKQGKWLSDWRISLPCPGHANSFSIAQVVECDNQVYLFSEREITGHAVEHRIDKLDNTDRASGVGTWTNVVRENKTGGRGLLVYPEYACVGFGVGKLCIFNTLEHTGKVYDMRHGGPPEPLPPPQTKGVEVFHSLNPLSFTFEPNFKSLVEVCKRPL